MNASVELPEQETGKNRYPKEVSPTFRTPSFSQNLPSARGWGNNMNIWGILKE